MSESAIGNRKVIYQPTCIGDFLIIGNVDDNWLEFTCYEATGQDPSVGYLFDRLNWKSLPDPVSDYREADIFLSGHIKWDGCANVRFDKQDHITLHFCGRDDAKAVGKLFNTLYDLAERMIPAWGC